MRVDYVSGTMLNAFTQLPLWPLITISDYFDPHFKMEAFEVSGSSESHILLILLD